MLRALLLCAVIASRCICQGQGSCIEDVIRGSYSADDPMLHVPIFVDICAMSRGPMIKIVNVIESSTF